MSIEDILDGIDEKFFSELADHGLVTIQTGISDRDTILANLLRLSERLGGVIPHTEKQLFTDVTLKPEFNDKSIIRPQSDNGPQAPHVDGVLSEETPTFLVMHCIHPSMIGGEPTYVDSRDVIDYILNEDYEFFAPLFQPDAVEIKRPNLKIKQRPVFRFSGDVLETYFSSHEYNTAKPTAKAAPAFDRLSNFIKDYKNQSTRKVSTGELTFSVNKRILHGRRAFTDMAGMERHYVRAWYDGSRQNIPSQAKGLRLNGEQLLRVTSLAR